MSQTVFVSMMTKRPDDAAAGIYDFGCDEGTHSGMLLMLRNPVHHGGDMTYGYIQHSLRLPAELDLCLGRLGCCACSLSVRCLELAALAECVMHFEWNQRKSRHSAR